MFKFNNRFILSNIKSSNKKLVILPNLICCTYTFDDDNICGCTTSYNSINTSYKSGCPTNSFKRRIIDLLFDMQFVNRQSLFILYMYIYIIYYNEYNKINFHHLSTISMIFQYLSIFFFFFLYFHIKQFTLICYLQNKSQNKMIIYW